MSRPFRCSALPTVDRLKLEFSGFGSRRRAGDAVGKTQRARDVVADGAIGSAVVVVSVPIFQAFGRVGRVHGPVDVKTFGPQLGSLNASIKPLPVGLPGREKLGGGLPGIGPQVEVAADELAAVVDPDRPWIADLPADSLGRLNHVFAAIPETRIRRRAEVGLDVHDREYPQLCTQGQLVMDQIHLLDVVRHGRHAASPGPGASARRNR